MKPEPSRAPEAETPPQAASPPQAESASHEFFAAAVREHGPAVHAYLSRRAGQQVADELLTEVWLRAWHSRQSYNPHWGGPRPWLYGIARNVLRAHWRLRMDRPALPVALAEDPWPAVDERVDAGRLRLALADALAALPDEYREVLLLVAWEQLTPAEVAATLGLPPGTVRSRLHRARRVLQRFVDAADAADAADPATRPDTATRLDPATPTPNPVYLEA